MHVLKLNVILVNLHQFWLVKNRQHSVPECPRALNTKCQNLNKQLENYSIFSELLFCNELFEYV
jgi:hypothetical protein